MSLRDDESYFPVAPGTGRPSVARENISRHVPLEIQRLAVAAIYVNHENAHINSPNTISSLLSLLPPPVRLLIHLPLPLSRFGFIREYIYFGTLLLLDVPY